MLNKQTASSDKELPWNVTVSREFLFQKQSQQPLPVTLRMAKYGRAVFPPDLCPSGINWVIKKPSSKTAFLWWSWRGSNPRPYGCEPYALPDWATGPNQQFQKRNRRIKQYEIIDVAENWTLCAPSWATSPNRPFFNQKSYEKQIFEIFGFEEKSRKTRLVNGKRTSAAGCSFIWLQTQRPPRWTMSPSSLSCNGR